MISHPGSRPTLYHDPCVLYSLLNRCWNHLMVPAIVWYCQECWNCWRICILLDWAYCRLLLQNQLYPTRKSDWQTQYTTKYLSTQAQVLSNVAGWPTSDCHFNEMWYRWMAIREMWHVASEQTDIYDKQAAVAHVALSGKSKIRKKLASEHSHPTQSGSAIIDCICVTQSWSVAEHEANKATTCMCIAMYCSNSGSGGYTTHFTDWQL